MRRKASEELLSNVAERGHSKSGQSPIFHIFLGLLNWRTPPSELCSYAGTTPFCSISNSLTGTASREKEEFCELGSESVNKVLKRSPRSGF
jgi:hypothetical protein